MDNIKGIIYKGLGLSILKDQIDLAVVDKDILYNLSYILLLKHLDLATTGGHATYQVAIEEELELELLKLIIIAVAAALLLLAPGLEVPVLGAAEQLLKGILELVSGLAKEGVAGSSVSRAVLKRVEVNSRLLAK